MTGRARLGVVLVALVAATALPAASAAGPPGRPAAADRQAAPQLRFTFDHGESLRRGTRVRNAGGRVHGRVVTAEGGRLRSVSGRPGRAARYPCGRCGRAVIEVPDRDFLDPDRARFRFGADVWLTPGRARRDSNLLQKGGFDDPGGQYKLQVDHGVPSCVVNGSDGRVVVVTRTRIDDRRRHRVVCARGPHGIVVRVDGAVAGRARGSTGVLANTAPVRVGGKGVGSDNDQFRGRVDNVFVRVGR